MSRSKYGSAHRMLVERWRPHAYGKPCNRCGRPMLPGEAIDLDHADDGSGRYIGGHPADSFSHSGENRAAGARTANRERGERRARTKRVVAAQRSSPAPQGVVMKFANVAMAVDIDVDREATFLVAAGRNDVGPVVIELRGQWPGGSTARQVAAAVGRDYGGTMLLDPLTAGTLTFPLRQHGVMVRELEPRVVRDAHATFVDLFKAGQVRHIPNATLTEAVKLAKLRKLAGRDELDLRGSEFTPAPIRAAAFAVTELVTDRTPRIYVWEGP